jgi:hypothetical protein
MTNRSESLHLHLHRTASGDYPELHIYLDDKPDSARPPTRLGPITVSSPFYGSPADAILDSSGEITICAFGTVNEANVCNVWGQVYPSLSAIPATLPSSVFAAQTGSGKWTIPSITFQQQSGAQTCYCVIWYRYVTASGFTTVRLPPIPFTPDPSAGKTECDDEIEQGGRIAASESFPAEYVLSPAHVTFSIERLSWPVVLKRSPANEAAAWTWRSKGWLLASLNVHVEKGRQVGLLRVRGILGAPFRSTISWRCQHWQSFGKNHLTLLKPCHSAEWPRSFLVEPARP